MVEAVAPLKYRRFRALWVASIFSNVGSFLQAVAASWLMLELTGSATWVGLMAASATLPLLFFALAAGAVADMFDRRWVLVAAQVTMGIAATLMAVVTAVDQMTPGLLLALGLMLGVGLAFNLPSWQATVPDLVPRGVVASAVALNSVAFNVARAVGPALGGFIIVVAGAQTAFALNAASYLGVIVVLVFLALRMETPERDETSMTNAIALGIRFARFTRPFRMVLVLAASFALTSAVVQSILPNRTDQLGGGPGVFGVLLGAMGAGALVGGFSRHPVTSRLGRWSLPTTVTTFGVAGVALGLAPSVPAAAAALVIAGMAWVWTLANLNATAQLLAPEWVRGRVMSLYMLSFAGILPIGSIVAGALADRIGPDGAEIVLSAGAVFLGLVVTPLLKIPSLSEIEPPEFTEDRSELGHADIEGGPVLVMNTWTLDAGDLEAFREAMNEIRLVRLRTGARRWRLYRETEDPHKLVEVFLVVSWDEHLAQHRRIDDASAELLRLARAFDRSDGPTTTHLVAVDLDTVDNWESLVAAHAEYHEQDGSIPIDRADAGTGEPHREGPRPDARGRDKRA